MSDQSKVYMGCTLCHHLLHDLISTGRKKNVEHWIGHTRFEIITHDVTDPIFLQVFKDGSGVVLGLPGHYASCYAARFW